MIQIPQYTGKAEELCAESAERSATDNGLAAKVCAKAKKKTMSAENKKPP